MRIQHNIMAMGAYRNYTNNVNAMKKNLEKLSSGYKINRAGDDAAGLAISEKMRAQITGLETAQKNAKDGISLVQTAEGALTEVHDMLNRMVTLATQSANGTYDNDVDRVQLQKEMDQLRTEINRIADSANFNGIKLFDGSLSGADVTVDGIKTSQIDMAKGVEVTTANGGGSKGVYTLNLSGALTDGDTIDITFGGKLSGLATKTFEYNNAAGANVNIAAAETVEGQAQSLANAIKGLVGADFTVEAKGTSIILTSTAEGNDASKVATITNAAVNTDKSATPAGGGLTDGVNDTAGKIGFGGLFEGDNSTGSMNISDGDEINISVTLADGTIAKLTAVAGKDFAVDKENGKTGDNLIDYLKTATFNDTEGTVIDESKIKISDLLDIQAAADATNKTQGLKIAVKDSLVNFAGTTGAEISIENTTTGFKATPAAVTGHTDTASGTAAKAAEFDISLGTGTTDAANLTIGDTVKLCGQLTDGRTFTVEAVAGEDFKVGKDYVATLTNLYSFLSGGDKTVQLKNADGSDSGAPVKVSSIFGDNAQIKLDATTVGSEKLVSVNKGKLASHITNFEIVSGDALDVSAKLKNGEQQSSADSTITFSDGLSYGAVVEVGGKNYEIVKSASDISNTLNKAVVVDDISDLNSVAKAMSNAIKGDLNAAQYKVGYSNNTVTVSSVAVGSSAEAISASTSGDKTTQLEFTLDPKKMQEGTTVTINGETYEFVGKDGKVSDAKNHKIEVNDFSKETASSLGSALAKLANGKNNASVVVDGDGKVTVRGLVDSATNKIVTPSAKFDGGTSGLTLQIGDTADDYNKMKVSIYKMKTADMGIDDISILDQDSAGAAIDKIRSAINYVSDVRGTLGATQNRLDHTINNLSVMQENIQDAESTIRDTDVASEMMAYTKNNILIQSAQAMLAQANQVPQGVLQLLQ